MSPVPRTLAVKAKGTRAAQQDGNHLGLRVGLLGAGAALLGSLIGGVFSLVTATMGYDNERESALREERAEAYFAFQQSAQAFRNRASQMSERDQDASLPGLLRTANAVQVYGSRDAFSASAEVQAGVGDALSAGSESDGAWDRYDEAMIDFTNVMRDELGDNDIPFNPFG